MKSITKTTKIPKAYKHSTTDVFKYPSLEELAISLLKVGYKWDVVSKLIEGLKRLPKYKLK